MSNDLLIYMNINLLVFMADDFNRVILSMRRGQEFTDYVNASFIDVSTYVYIQE